MKPNYLNEDDHERRQVIEEYALYVRQHINKDITKEVDQLGQNDARLIDKVSAKPLFARLWVSPKIRITEAPLDATENLRIGVVITTDFKCVLIIRVQSIKLLRILDHSFWQKSAEHNVDPCHHGEYHIIFCDTLEEAFLCKVDLKHDWTEKWHDSLH